MWKTILACLASCVFWEQGVCAQTTYYVTTNGNNVSPYTNSWADAATNIHDVVALATNGGTILLGNGVFWVTNQIRVSTGLTFRGVSGPASTVVARAGAASIRPFWLAHSNAVLDSLSVSNGKSSDGIGGGGIRLDSGMVSNCIVAKGFVDNSASRGGCVYQSGGLLVDTLIRDGSCYSPGRAACLYISGGVAERCVIREAGGAPESVWVAGGVLRQSTICSNRTSSSSGGFYLTGGRIENCLVFSNSATYSGGAGGGTVAGGVLVHTTVANNQSPSDGAAGGLSVTAGAVSNCIIWGNLKGAVVSDCSGATGSIRYSCAAGLTVTNGNLADDPLFAGVSTGNYRLAVGSICRDHGINLASVTTDLTGGVRPIDGNGDGSPVADMGAYEAPAMTSGEFAVWITTSDSRNGFAPLTVTLQAVPAGSNTNITWYGWDIGNDGVWDLQGGNLGSVTTNLPAGRYTVTLQVTNSDSVTACATVTNMFSLTGSNIYVSVRGSNVYPYVSWTAAATNIMDGLAAALPGCQVNVDTGLYWMTSTFKIDFPLTVQGIYGPRSTVVARAGAAYFRPFWLAHSNALLNSITVSNGLSSDSTGAGNILLAGGVISNCIITKGSINNYGGRGAGIYQTGGLLTGVLIRNNSCVGSPTPRADALYMSGGMAEQCVVCNDGGGAVEPVWVAGGVLRQSTICSNRNGTATGGFCLTGGRMENCLVFSNSTTGTGGAGGGSIGGGVLLNCTVTRNSATNAGVGGVTCSAGVITNSIIHGNTGTLLNDYNGAVSSAWYSCASELTAGLQGNVTGDPNFRNAAGLDFHLRGGSSCIDQGITLAGMANQIDLDGNPRVVGGKVDMGSYEAKSQGTIFMIR
jgi:PKD repeat protein